MNQNCKVIFLSNFLDDATRINRKIETDSPACSRKILMMAQALSAYDQNLPLILSMGRGRQLDSRVTFYKNLTTSIQGIVVLYASFLPARLFSQLISVLSLCYILCRIRILYPALTLKLVAWNRTNAYLLPLLISKILFFQNYLDLEDSDYFPSGRWFTNFFVKARIIAYDYLCDSGRLLSTQYLRDSRYRHKQLVYYGFLDSQTPHRLTRPFSHLNHGSSIHFLFCGTLTEDTGADTLLKCLDMLKHYRNHIHYSLVFHICGYGPYIPVFRDFALAEPFPQLIVYGRLPNHEFNTLLKKIDISLALKKVSGPLSKTTFPSKVLELAGSGHHIITTDVSDIKKVLGEDSVSYLYDDNPRSLMSHVLECVYDIDNVRSCSILKSTNLRQSFCIQSSRDLLLDFLDIS